MAEQIVNIQDDSVSQRIDNSITNIIQQEKTNSLLNLSDIATDVVNYPRIYSEPYKWHEIDGYEENWDGEASEVTRVFEGPWLQRKGFVDWMVGYSYNSAGTLRREIPDQHPAYPWLYCTGIRRVKGQGAYTLDPYIVNPDGTNAGLIAYFDRSSGTDELCCTLSATYRPLAYEVRNDSDIDTNAAAITAAKSTPELQRYVERAETDSLQSLPFPGANLVFTEGPANGKAIPSAGTVTKLFPLRELIYVWHDVPDVPEAAITACEGKVNVDVFDPPVTINGNTVGALGAAGGYAAGTLLCQAPQKKRIPRNVVGRPVFRITYRFLFRPDGWNRFPYGGDMGMYLAAVGGKYLYASADFNTLFQVPQPIRYQ